jgi:uncharacterized protein
MAVEGISTTSWGKPQIGELPGGRLHLQHGPIDLVIKATGESVAVRQAYAAAIALFSTMLAELTSELVELRQSLDRESAPTFISPVARRMLVACWPYRAAYITPMAAVAGSVADEVLAAMLAAAPALHAGYVNNGGDVAVYVAKGHVLKIGVVADLVAAIPEGVITVTPESGIGGIATSGWRGRSFSLGIADAATVLASTAAAADAAATMVANAVNINDPGIRRAAANMLDPDSDLGDRLVTIGVGQLPIRTSRRALNAGVLQAQSLIQLRLILAAYLCLQSQSAVVPPSTEKLLP